MMRRDELRDKALDYFLEHGLAELSLRPLAQQIGTSARLLAYHFESKEKLIMAVMETVRNRVQESVTTLMQAASGKVALEAIWQWMTDAQNVPYVRLLFEVQVLALQHPTTYARYLSDSSASWLDVIEHGIPASAQRRTIATLCSAVIDGLALDYISTGNLDQTTASLKYFVRLLGQQPDPIQRQENDSHER
ncbi:MAG TPA: TetR/AcrR family transcriptional regulator [Pseudoduganella sp.]